MVKLYKCKEYGKEFEKDEYTEKLWKKFLVNEKQSWCCECLKSIENKMYATICLMRRGK